ncbi:MAG: hypothetical protein WHT29_11355 [Bacteroidales bacterium]
MRREIMQAYGSRASKRQLCQWLNLPRSSGYYKPSGGKRGVKPSTHTLTRDVFERYFNWHNHKTRRHALGKISPADYWHTAFPCHPA